MTADRYGHLFPRSDDRAELAAAEKAPVALKTPAAPTPAQIPDKLLVAAGQVIE